jgi:hypothetical protein
MKKGRGNFSPSPSPRPMPHHERDQRVGNGGSKMEVLGFSRLVVSFEMVTLDETAECQSLEGRAADNRSSLLAPLRRCAHDRRFEMPKGGLCFFVFVITQELFRPLCSSMPALVSFTHSPNGSVGKLQRTSHNNQLTADIFGQGRSSMSNVSCSVVRCELYLFH